MHTLAWIDLAKGADRQDCHSTTEENREALRQRASIRCDATMIWSELDEGEIRKIDKVLILSQNFSAFDLHEMGVSREMSESTECDKFNEELDQGKVKKIKSHSRDDAIQ